MADFSDLIGTASGGAASGRVSSGGVDGIGGRSGGVSADMSGTGDRSARSAGGAPISGDKRSSGGASDKGRKASAGSMQGGKGSKRSGGKSGASKTRTRGAAVEQVAGDVVQTSGGRAVDMLPASVEDVARMWPAWAGEWCELHGVPDMRKASPLIYRAMCREIGQRYIKPSYMLKDTKAHRVGPAGGAITCGAYDPEIVTALYDLFRGICDDFDKPPFASTFAAFSGVSESWLSEYGDKLTSKRVGVRQKLHAAEIDSIRQQASRDPVGRIAILNNEHWGGASNDRSTYAPAQQLDSIPAASAFGLIEGPRLD